MNKKRKTLVSFLIITLCIFCGCGQSSSKNTTNSASETLNIAYQYGLSYAPLIVCKEKDIIENEYKKRTGKTLQINWSQMNSGPDINTAFASGSLDVACMGIAPAITGITNNIGYKIFTNISGQEHGLMTNDPSINSLEDYIGSDKQIALVNIGSIQHIILAISLENAGFDAHELDANIVGMKHPDGMVALESNAISGHLTSNPYIYMERYNNNLHEIMEVKSSWSVENSFIVGVASEKIHQNTELYDVVCDSIKIAIDYINSNPEEIAKITCDLDGNTYEDELKYLTVGSYSSETSGILNLSSFMYKNDFISKEVHSYDELVYSNVNGD